MKLSIISFTENGILLSEKTAKMLSEECVLYTKCGTCGKHGQTVRFVTGSIGEWAKEQFEERNALLFIGACGIAVRAVAPHITDKLHDSPVLAMDENGRYVIPLLSGHVGGANELAVSIAEITGAEPVITTATDIHNKFAIDMFAKRNGLIIVNKEGIARVSSKVLAGESIVMSVEHGHSEKDVELPEGVEMAEYPPLQRVDVVIASEDREFETSILLRPKEYVIGVGCRKGKEADKIEDFIVSHLQEAGISLVQVSGMASVDAKKDEPGFLVLSHKEKIPFITYTAEELRCVEGNFHKSEFVKKQVGVDNVCERAALKMCGQGGRLIYGKSAEDGMTIAIARRDWRVSFDEK